MKVNFAEKVIKLGREIGKCREKRDQEGMEAVRKELAALWANASDEDLNSLVS